MALLYADPAENQDPGYGGAGGAPTVPVPVPTTGGHRSVGGGPARPEDPGPAAPKVGLPAYGPMGPDFPSLNFGSVPMFNTAKYTPLDANSLLSAPGYQSRLHAGEDALQRAAASNGVLRTGGTLEDLIKYGQDFASNEYNTAEGNNRAAYSLNYQLAKDQYAPLLAQWNTLAGANLQKALAMYNRGTVWLAPHVGGGGGYIDPFPQPGQYGL